MNTGNMKAGKDLVLIKMSDILNISNSALIEESGIKDIEIISFGRKDAGPPPIIVGPPSLKDSAEFICNHMTSTQDKADYIIRATFEDAIVSGFGNVITRNNLLIYDSCWEAIQNRFVPVGLKKTDSGEFQLLGNPEVKIDRPSVLAKRPWWQNYGHWLFDCATVIEMFSSKKNYEKFNIIIGKYENEKMRSIVFECIDMLNLNANIIEHHDAQTWEFSSLVYTMPMWSRYKLPDVIHSLRRFVLPNCEPCDVPQKIYLVRRDRSSRSRPLKNEDEIIQLCQDMGFQIIEPEKYTLRQQAYIFGHAKIIVGIKGAGFSNLVFSEAGSCAILLSPKNWIDTFFWEISSQIGVEYIEVIGETLSDTIVAPSTPFVVDIETLKDILSSKIRDIQ